MARYKQIATDLRQQIKEGHYDEALRLPTEDQLMTQFNTSRNTLRNAVDLLVGEGILYRVQGSGIYIRQLEHPDTISVTSIRGIHSEFKDKKNRTEVLELTLLAADEKIKALLQCPLGTPVYFVKRLRIIENVPFTIEYSYFNKQLIPYLGREIAEKSIYRYIEEDLLLKIGFADKYIRAEKLTETDSLLLGMTAGEPTLTINERVYLANGSLFNSSKVIHNYQQATLFVAANNH